LVTPGSRIGSYEVLAKIGEGGMGEVYRARDTRLGRDVAIKLLPDAFAADPDRLARFEREAQTLAALNHPNIAHIYGVLEAPPALVMELVEGEDLARRIARGPLPLEEALPVARQIADALEAAHDQGIVHRDLKPANIKLRPDGTVKVLDFGLAKAMDQAHAASGPALDNSPTFTSHGTQLGVIIGTAAYMSPEQARGKAVDRRADVWAFGVVLYEMLTGRRAFEGEELSDVLASVLKSDPAWNTIPADTPAAIRRLLRRCLEKDPRKRLTSIADARLDLDEIDAPTVPAAPAIVRAAPRRMLPYVAAALAGALLAGAAVFAWFASRPTATARVERLSLLPPPGESLYPDSSGVALSPDGTMVAFIVGSVVRSDTQLWVRSLDSLAARHLEGAEGASLPFWSPDSRQIGFFTSTKLKAIPASGGRTQVLADLRGGGRGATWNQSNVIVYAPDASGPLYRVSAMGGTPVQVTSLDQSRKQYGHRFPWFLPDGDHFLYAALPGKSGRFDIFAGSLSGGAPALIGAMESAPVYADPGYLLYARQGVLLAQPFDAASLHLAGDPITLADEPSAILDPASSYTAGRPTSVAASGAMAYYSASSLDTTADWYDTLGRRTGTLALPAGHYEAIRISPDGTHAVVVRSVSPSESSLWLTDLARGGATPLSSGPGRNDAPVWSPDGSKIMFTSDRDGPADFFVKAVGDAVAEEPIFRSPTLFKNPSAWSPDGKWIVVTQLDPGTAQNVSLLSADGTGAMTPLVVGPTRDVGGSVSPDGRWLMYFSDESGRYQLYVQSFPTPGRRVQVSQQGGVFAWWAPDGRRIRFVGDDTRSLWQVDVTTGATFSAGAPSLMAQLPAITLAVDATPDLQRFIVLAAERTGTGSITVVQNWRAAMAGKR
jgi:Tol biopolymer transport system component